MSETSTLISCTGKITRAELAKLPTPLATETHIPIPHAAVVETFVETLSHRHIGVVSEEFAVSSDAMVPDGYTWMVGTHKAEPTAKEMKK